MATIKEIKEQLANVTLLTDPAWEEFEKDTRVGVIAAIKKRQNELKAEQLESDRLEMMLTYEKNLYQLGKHLIAGIDEVGRGPLAGPVVAAAVILPKNLKIRYLNDSKKIPKSKHKTIYEEIKKKAVSIGVGIVSNEEIDNINIYQATKKAMTLAIDDLSIKPDHLLVDAMQLEIPIAQTSIIKGDANSLSIAAASVVAKVVRDRLMTDYEKLYPEYEFSKNAGYGTPNHLKALKLYGVTPIHRNSFEPIKSLLNR